MTRRAALPAADGVHTLLQHRYWLRLHGSAIGTATLGASWVASRCS